MKAEYAQRLGRLRGIMERTGLDALFVPRTDAFQSEVVRPCDERLRWVSGFTGSAGVLVVTPQHAVLFTDGRYTLQARQQMDADCFRIEDISVETPHKWLEKNMKAGSRIGIDPALHTVKQVRELQSATGPFDLVLLPENPVDAVWEERPMPASNPLRIFPDRIAGRSSAEKRALILEAVRAQDLGGYVLSAPDSLSWLLNVRGSDIPHTPVALSYGVLDAQTGMLVWFVDPEALSDAVRAHIGESVKIEPFDRLPSVLKTLRVGKPIGLDERLCPYAIYNMLEQGGAPIMHFKDPCILPRACKTDSEKASIRDVHRRDGAAMVRMLHWLATLEQPEAESELSVEAKLEGFRRMDETYQGPSFSTIAGSGPHGAIIHYRATSATNRALESGQLLLLDSGGQYDGGTTDITRTIAIGEPDEDMRSAFTAVLKGHIALARAHFPQGTTGAQLDVLARQPLWDIGLDYAHGTGHGVGCNLSVHEEAASISSRGQDPLLPGMLLSNEPGFYKEGQFGIRTENLVFVEKTGEHDPMGRAMLAFNTVSLAPIERSLIVPSRMTQDEKDWLNTYHRRVHEEIAPLVEEPVRGWLAEATAPL